MRHAPRATRHSDDEIFAHAAEAHAEPLARLGQCHIILHGTHGCWRYGAEEKLRDCGVELGDVRDGIAYYGNLSYEGYGSQEQAIFLIKCTSHPCHP